MWCLAHGRLPLQHPHTVPRAFSFRKRLHASTDNTDKCPDVWHGAATNTALPSWIPFCAYLLIMVIELPNLWSNFPNLPPLQPIPIVQHLSILQERKERLKGIPEFLRPSPQRRQRAIIGPNSAFITGVAPPVTVPHRADSTAYTHQSRDHFSCIHLREPDTGLLHKIHTIKGHSFPGEHLRD